MYKLTLRLITIVFPGDAKRKDVILNKRLVAAQF